MELLVWNLRDLLNDKNYGIFHLSEVINMLFGLSTLS